VDLGGSETVLGPIAADDPKDEGEEEEQASASDTSVDPSARLIDSGPLQRDLTINEPVTSGGDRPGDSN
jgi:hypothetical protein